jgi:hypothetical protein
MAITIKTPQRAAPGNARYNTRAYANAVIEALRVWDANGRNPMLMTSEQVGMEPGSIRTSWYCARQYVLNHTYEFTPSDVELIKAFSLAGQTNPRGVIICNSNRAAKFAGALTPISREPDNDKAYVEFLDWIELEHEPMDARTFAGPFNLDDMERFKKALDMMQGMYLADIKMDAIKVIYYPSGSMADAKQT